MVWIGFRGLWLVVALVKLPVKCLIHGGNPGGARLGCCVGFADCEQYFTF